MDDSSKAIFSTDVSRPETPANNKFNPKSVYGLSMFTTVPGSMRPPHHSTFKRRMKTPNVEEEASKLESRLDPMEMKSDPGTEDGMDHRRETDKTASETECTAEIGSHTRGDIAEKRTLNQKPKPFEVTKLQSDGAEVLSSTTHVPPVTAFGWEDNMAFVAKGGESSLTSTTPPQQRPVSVSSFDKLVLQIREESMPDIDV